MKHGACPGVGYDDTTPTHVITLNYVIFKIIDGVDVSVSMSYPISVFVVHGIDNTIVILSTF
jgi:hypothetical protein